MGFIHHNHDDDLFPNFHEPPLDDLDTKPLHALHAYKRKQAAAKADVHDERERIVNRARQNRLDLATSAYDHDLAWVREQEAEVAAIAALTEGIYEEAADEDRRRDVECLMPGDFDDQRTQYRAVGFASLRRTVGRLIVALGRSVEGVA